MKQNPGDAKLSVDQLQQMLQSNNYSTLMSKLMHYAKNVTGSNSYWHKAKEDLRATIAQVGPPTIFFTLSCAEYHWPELHNFIDDSQSRNISPEIRQQHVFQNPHIIDWLFTERTDHGRRFLGQNSGLASWPSTNRYIEAVIIKLCEVFPSSSKSNGRTIRCFSLVSNAYRRIRELVLNDPLVMGKTQIQLVDINVKTLTEW